MIYIYINGRDGVAPAVFLASCWAFLASCWYKLLAAATSAKLAAGQEEKGITVNHFTKSLCSIRRINSQSSWLCDHQKWSVEVDVSKLSAHVCICRNMAQTHRFMRTKRSCNSLAGRRSNGHPVHTIFPWDFATSERQFKTGPEELGDTEPTVPLTELRCDRSSIVQIGCGLWRLAIFKTAWLWALHSSCLGPALPWVWGAPKLDSIW